ncbi:hypothetical protein GTU79_15135 [Sodalis ligni]|uniref:hypothetical protein n=1 Tax=Sodalis ligni TaxID=2697027 RepID=UPI00193F2C43|nr:hypothetical protein [Sodalis ligni]QWA08882.1 hypothetical protein GTU79_15135 [Sodalis ligni]
MDRNYIVEVPRHGSFFLSWVAYVRPWILFAMLTAIGLLVSQSANAANIILAGYVILFIGIVKLIYDLAWRRRFRFFYDLEGVWLVRGLLPGRRGKKGLSWLEIDEVACDSGPFSWLTKSYGITISHRFSATRQLHISQIKHGDRAVAAINERLMQEFTD